MQIVKEAQRAVERKSIDLSGPILTDQSYKKSCDINNIVKAYKKTGILPQAKKQGYYADVSEIPSLETAFEVASKAAEAFLDLPADVRKLMDNDASKLGLWLSDEANHDLAVKYGLLEKKAQVADTISHDNSNTSTGNTDAIVND